jgi:hypothetical protein
MKPHLKLLRTFAFLLCAAAAQAVPLVYSATLSGEAENPDVITPGTGWTVVTYDPDAHTLRVEIEFSGLVGNTTASHIHAPIDMITGNAGVATQTPSFSGFPLGVTAGTYDMTFDLTQASSWNAAFITNRGGGTVEGAEMALAGFLADGLAYVNVHSSFAGGGEVRGDLQRVPEATSAALLLAPALLALGLARRRRGAA